MGLPSEQLFPPPSVSNNASKECNLLEQLRADGNGPLKVSEERGCCRKHHPTGAANDWIPENAPHRPYAELTSWIYYQ